MLPTIELGICVRAAPDTPQGPHNIGIRIEDGAIVTARGCEPISWDVPVDADAIETLMRG
jgi:Xaa-Pro aminopeptidase